MSAFSTIAATTASPILSGDRIIDPSLNHAWAARVCNGENVAKIEVMRKHDESIVVGERHDLGVERSRITKF